MTKVRHYERLFLTVIVEDFTPMSLRATGRSEAISLNAVKGLTGFKGIASVASLSRNDIKEKLSQ